jgi:hypothetical protein
LAHFEDEARRCSREAGCSSRGGAEVPHHRALRGGYAMSGSLRLLHVVAEGVTVPERSTAPFVLVESEPAYTAALQEILGAGWTVQNPGGGPGPRVVTMIGVVDRTDAETALLCALRGDGLLLRDTATASDSAGVIGDLVEDLTRIGPVHVARADAIRLDSDTWRLLHALSAGLTVAAAARVQHLSPRTANRRVTDAREAFGVQSRAQLLRAMSAPGRVRAAPA